MDRRFYAIRNLLSEYADGNTEYSLSMYMSHKGDEIDFAMRCINMLGDDLAANLVSKDYFNRIFNAIPNMIFILNAKGDIIDLNKAVNLQLGYSREQLLGKTMRYLHASGDQFSAAWLKSVKGGQDVSYTDSFFSSADGTDIPVHLSAAFWTEPFTRRIKILITANAKDNSQRLRDGNTVII